MLNTENMKFEVIAGKVPKEMAAAMNEGWREAYRVAIKGGFEVHLARMTVGIIEGFGRREVLVLEVMPPAETLDKAVEPKEAMMTRPNIQGGIAGIYGMACGRKFFVPSKKPFGSEVTGNVESVRSSAPRGKQKAR
jgi:hypothetical protein